MLEFGPVNIKFLNKTWNIAVRLNLQEINGKVAISTVKCSNKQVTAKIFFHHKKLMTQCHYSDHNLKMIIIIKAIIGFEISFWTEFFQIPQFDTGSGVWWRTTLVPVVTATDY